MTTTTSKIEKRIHAHIYHCLQKTKSTRKFIYVTCYKVVLSQMSGTYDVRVYDAQTIDGIAGEQQRLLLIISTFSSRIL